MDNTSKYYKPLMVALVYTSLTGIFAGIMYLISLSSDTEMVNNLKDMSVVAVAVGGVAMGIIYLAFILTRKK